MEVSSEESISEVWEIYIFEAGLGWDLYWTFVCFVLTISESLLIGAGLTDLEVFGANHRHTYFNWNERKKQYNS